MLTNKDYLFLAICHKAWSFQGDPKFSATEYLKTYADEISALGRALEDLNLAQKSERNGLGWKPTPYLLSVVAKQKVIGPVPSKKIRTDEDIAILDVIVASAIAGTAGRRKRRERYHFITRVLTVLGLSTIDAEGDAKPTRLLRDLFWDSYVRGIPKPSF